MYLKGRVDPSLGDCDYLHLKDLRTLLQTLAPEVRGDVFDYGCGGAPYRSLFTHCRRYVAADIVSGPAVDKVISSDGSTGEPDASYDLVFSCQVLEHVKDPGAYLRECRRILRPGGRLLLSTHGMMQEHGCPFDFYRWTCNGLEHLVRQNAFEVIDSYKLTTQIRAFVLLLNQLCTNLEDPKRKWRDFFLWAARRIYNRIGLPALNWLADFFPEQGVVSASHGTPLYTCICVHARRPPD
jgi:SAM-dependent methyltransferase